MATDDQNKDREEDDFFGDDDDFGLPELDYEALDDDASDDTSSDSDSGEEEDFSDLEGVFEDMDDEDVPDMVDDAELEAEIEAEMGASESTEESSDEFFQEESFDDFGDGESDMPDVSDEEITDSVFDSDVLDDDEFKDFEKELMESEESDLGDLDSFTDDDFASSPVNETGGKGNFAKVVIIGIVIFASLGALLWFLAPSFSDESKEVAEKPKQQPVTKPVEKPAEQAVDQEQSTESVAEKTNDASEKPAATQKPAATRPASTRPAAKKPAVTTNPGEVNALTARTSNFYIVIGSFIDGDMAMDYANKLASNGKSPYIIPPFGKAITHRVAIQGYGTLAQAQGAVDGFKSEYGQDIWILKY